MHVCVRSGGDRRELEAVITVIIWWQKEVRRKELVKKWVKWEICKIPLCLYPRNGEESSLPGKRVQRGLAVNHSLKLPTGQWNEKQRSWWQSVWTSFAWSSTTLANKRLNLFVKCDRSAHTYHDQSHFHSMIFFIRNSNFL